MWFIGVEVEQETSAPPPKKNPGSAAETSKSVTPFNSLKTNVTLRYLLMLKTEG